VSRDRVLAGCGVGVGSRSRLAPLLQVGIEAAIKGCNGFIAIATVQPTQVAPRQPPVGAARAATAFLQVAAQA